MRRLLILVGAVIFVDTMFFAAITPLLPHYSDELGLSKAAAGLLAGTYAAGTLLGGWWASYSWGRFWGWDAKETSIFVALLFYLAILHGRMIGILRDFGTAVGAVLGFLGVLWAWYGVNFVLGVGLHSYGFTEGGSQGMMMVIIAGMLALPVAAAWRRSLGYRAWAAA